ncbi:MAG: flap structure-specific endonuclease [Candidatus Proteinoplasmatales archaeon SG8-5]|nr:MAG: flap structure-specific endonuclease [Candidatus Proteinoplasmatales archaeon SG8-5]
MGVDISDLVEGKVCELGDFCGKAIAIDGYNTLYQFLSSIRGPDGTPLKDSKGRITSHLSGAFQRTSNLLEAGIKPVFVFDGKPNPLKIGTLKLRKERKEKAKEQWEEALRVGDLETARIKAQQTSRLTREMVEQAVELLARMGIPSVQAPEEGEAQASHMARKGDVYAVASQDFDSLLFGAPRLIRNLTLAGRRKMPRRNVYVDVKPEVMLLDDVLAKLGFGHEQLVDLGVLVGTDFNEGVKGIGPKKALKLLNEYETGKKAIEAKGLDVPGFRNVRRIFLEPNVTDDYGLEWGSMDREGVESLLCDEFEFTRSRIQSTLDKVEEGQRKRAQKSLDSWF